LDKANIFLPVFAVITIILVGIFSYTFWMNIEKSSKMSLGSPSLEIIRSYEKAEKAKFYIQESAKIAAWQSIEEISSSFNSFDSKFLEIFNKNLNNNLKRYTEISLLQDNYDYSIDTSKNLIISGKQKQPISITINNNLSMTYYFSQDFGIEIPFDIGYYLTLSKDLWACFKSDAYEQCLDSLKQKNILTYKTDEPNKNLINFEIPAGNNIYTNKLIIIKFNEKINELLP